jgi:aspartate/methionine/tyrosine aminotransferase
MRVKQLQTGEVKYAGGLPELREKIAGFYRQRYAVTVTKNDETPEPGHFCCTGVSLNPGEELLMADPVTLAIAILLSCLMANQNYSCRFNVPLSVDSETHQVTLD